MSAIPRQLRWILLAGMVAVAAAAPLEPPAQSPWAVQVWRGDGLPEKLIHGVAQTPDGFLWVATNHYLARFDGVRFEPFAASSFIDEQNLRIYALINRRAGGLWMAFDQGPVVSVDAGRVEIQRTGLPSAGVESMVEDNEGCPWISYRNGNVYRIKAGKVSCYTTAEGLPAGQRCALMVDGHGQVWFANNGQIGVFHEGRCKILLQLSVSTTRLAPSHTGGFWIFSGIKLLKYEDDGRVVEHGTLPPEHLAAERTALLEDRTGAVWLGTAYGGLLRYAGQGFENIPTSHRTITSLTEDREGNIWAGTGDGLERVQPRAVNLEGGEAGLPNTSVRLLAETNTGDLWAATHGGALLERDDDRWAIRPALGGTSISRVTALATDPSGDVWIGTRDYRVVRWQAGQLSSWSKNEGIIPHTIYQLLVSRTGDVWLGGEGPNTIQRLHNGTWDLLPLPASSHRVRAIAEDTAGTLWFGTDRGMLVRVAGDRLIEETAVLAAGRPPIQCLFAAPDGALWIGYKDGGLGRLKSGKFSQLTAAQGLFDDDITQIMPDGKGWLWFSSAHGIFKMRTDELTDVAEGRSARGQSVRLGRSYGFTGLQGGLGDATDALRTHDGRLWMPMGSALAIIQPDKLHDELTPPPVLLQRVAIDGVTRAFYGGILPLPQEDRRSAVDLRAFAPLQLAPDHRKVEFEFTALSFSAPENVNFRYRLDGVDENWVEAGVRRSASYSRLPAGDYRFRVKACNGSGVWNETGTILAFTVEPFIWQTWWFQIAAVLGFTGIVTAAVRYASFRKLRWKLQRLEQQAAVEKERTRIARDIHDDVGNRLTKITLLSGLALRDREEPRKISEHAHKISATARQVVDSLDEIVWAVNPRNDTLAHLINYVGQFAVDFLSTAGLEYRTELPSHPPDRPVSSDVRHNVFLAVKEALHNAVRHAHAREVSLHVIVSEETIRLSVVDDGRGFIETPAAPGADGLRNMRQRLEEVGGEFKIASQPGAGTRVTFIFRCTARG